MDKRGFLRTLVVAALAMAMLSGCSSVKNMFGGRNKDKTGEPAKLVDFTPSASVNKLWSTSVGKGEDLLGIGQQPAVLDGHVYAAAVDGGVSAYALSTGSIALSGNSRDLMNDDRIKAAYLGGEL